MKELIEKIKETYGDIVKVATNVITLFSKGRTMRIIYDNNTLSDCCYKWSIVYKNELLTSNNRSNLQHMINTVIRIFME